jgi:UDP-glucose 4-epimerase
MASVLVTGGAGYVGSHTVRELLDRGHDVAVVDDLSQGHREAVPAEATWFRESLLDRAAVDRVLRSRRFDAVLHFAARSLVGESMRDPWPYLRDNVLAAAQLIEATIRAGVERFVLSSTANLFGTPRVDGPLAEDAPIDPGSPYGESKQTIERMLVWAERVHGLRSARLRYFNAAGAHPTADLGEHHDPETHLIPIVLDVAHGDRAGLTIFGTDYPTADGTCVRDYVHVCDLADAHVRALDQLRTRSCVYNLGNGGGYSVREVVECARRITGHPIPAIDGPRRAGDPAVLVASSDRAKRELGWVPRFADLESIVGTAWAFKRRRPGGFGPSELDVEPAAARR